MSWIRESIRNIHERHERVKHFVHNGFRYPLPKYGQILMGMVYFSIPVIGGWYAMQWSISKSHEYIGVNGEKLPPEAMRGGGRHRPVVVDEQTGAIEYQKVGAGGWGGGVNLAASHEETRKRNKRRFQKFLKQERKRFEKQQPPPPPPTEPPQRQIGEGGKDG
jgi:hypothetical protein